MGEEAAEVSEGEVVQGEAATDGTNIRKGRSLSLALGAAKLTGAVVGGHFGKKLGFGTGLAIGLGAKKHASKDEDHPVHLKKAHTAPIVHHKHHLKTEKVCRNIPFKQCTSNQVCEQVPREKCEKLPVKNRKQVPNTKCWTTPHEVCTMVTDTKCKNVPHETCHQVPEEKCRQEPHQRCWDEPREHCHDKTVRLERKVCVHETKKKEVVHESKDKKKW